MAKLQYFANEEACAAILEILAPFSRKSRELILATVAANEPSLLEVAGQSDFGKFLAECCEFCEESAVSVQCMEQEYCAWARRNGGVLLDGRAQAARFEAMGLKLARRRAAYSEKQQRVWVGVGLRAEHGVAA